MNLIIYFFAVVLIFIAIAYACVHVYFKHEKKHHIRHVVSILGAAVTSWLVAHSLKSLIGHLRPDLTHTLVTPIDPYSFPSGHAAFMFALAFAMYSFDKKAGKILIAAAILTGIGRVLAGVHYWYDIVGGAILGYIVAFVVVYVCKRLIKTA